MKPMSSSLKSFLIISSLATASILLYNHYKRKEKKPKEIPPEKIPNDTQEKFNAAIKQASTIHSSKLENGDKLLLYGLYKQATIGDATQENKPSILDVTGMYKYDAWCKFKELSRVEAMRRYIEMVHYFENMDENADIIYSDDEYDEDEDDDDAGGVRDRTTEYGLGLKPSSLLPVEMSEVDVNNDNDNSIDEQLRNAAGSNDINRIQSILDKIQDEDIINKTDENGQTALHFAVDKGNIKIISLLLQKGAKTNVQDIDGISTLMTCILSSSTQKKEIFELLLEHGENLDLKDCDGFTVKDYILEQKEDDDDCLNDILKLCS